MIKVPQFRIKVVPALILTAVLGSVPFFFQNCSNVGFTKGEDAAASTAGGANDGDATGNLNQNSCNQTQLQNLTTPVKILLVVDTSGSNAGDATHAGTDPGKVMRAGSIQAFFNDFGSKPNFNWGFITFKGTSATALLNNGNNGSSPAFTASSATMQSAISYFKTSVSDSGVTPYQAAISMAHTAIANAADTPQTKYIVVFLSDGMPTDYPDSTAGDNQISADVQALIGLKAGRISFNTVYYGPSDAGASGRLHMMATAGAGQFLDTNSGTRDFLVNNVVTVPGSNCPN